MIVGTSWNILRPETIESLFYLWRFTGNKTYQEWGWNIFQAFEKNSRIETGYVGLKDVRSSQTPSIFSPKLFPILAMEKLHAFIKYSCFLVNLFGIINCVAKML